MDLAADLAADGLLVWGIGLGSGWVVGLGDGLVGFFLADGWLVWGMDWLGLGLFFFVNYLIFIYFDKSFVPSAQVSTPFL